MLGMPDAMDDEESEEVPILPAKPQKTLITNFFKLTDNRQGQSRKKNDVSGYLSSTKGHAIKKGDIDLIGSIESKEPTLITSKRLKGNKQRKKTQIKEDDLDECCHTSGLPVKHMGEQDDLKVRTTQEEVSYADFLKSTSNEQDARCTHDEVKLNGSGECKLDKDVLYQDPLKSCDSTGASGDNDKGNVKPALAQYDNETTDGDAKKTTNDEYLHNAFPLSRRDSHASTEEEQAKADSKPKQRGIGMFFHKLDSSSVQKKKQGSTIITTKAVVHDMPIERPSPLKQKKITMNPRSNVSIKGKDVDFTIIQLSTEIIDITVSKKTKRMSPLNTNNGSKEMIDLTEETQKGDLTGETGNRNSGKIDRTEHIKRPNETGDTKRTGYSEDSKKVDETRSTKKPNWNANAIKPNSTNDSKNTSEESSKASLAETNISEEIMEENSRGKLQEIGNRKAVCMVVNDEVPVVATNSRKQATLSFSNIGLVMAKPLVTETTSLKVIPKDHVAAESQPSENAECTQQVPKAHRPKRKCRSSTMMVSSDNTELSTPDTCKSHRCRSRIYSSDTMECNSTRQIQLISSNPKKLKKHSNQRMVNTKRKKVLNSVFESSVEITPSGTKQQTGIKIKFKRLKKPSSDEDFFSSKSRERQQKAIRAQKLLVIARSTQPKKKLQSSHAHDESRPAHKMKKKNTTSKKSSSPIPVRRSSRRRAQASKDAICDSSEEKDHHKDSKKVAKSERAPEIKKTPLKKRKRSGDTSTNTAPVKLASIFCKEKALVKTSMIVLSDDEAEEEDPKTLAIRKQFLLSGVPESLRKQQVLMTDTDAGFPLFPDHSHTRQRMCVDTVPFDPFDLPRVQLKLINESTHVVSAKQWDLRAFSDIAPHNIPPAQIVQEPERVPVCEETLQYLLGEISRFNPAYPVRRVFRQLKRKQTNSASESTLGSDSYKGTVAEAAEKSNCKKRKLAVAGMSPEKPTRQSKRQRASYGEVASLRRKGQESVSGEEHVSIKQAQVETRVPRIIVPSQDVQLEDTWTEKYEPMSGSEVLGHSGCHKKLKAWLVEWKQCTDLELRRARKQILKQARRGGKSKEDAKLELKKKLGLEWDDDSDFELSNEDSDYEEDEWALCNSMLLCGPHGIGKTALVYALAKELGYKVFEVNASSSRNGKQVLEQLQEATQSHQVSKKNLDAMYTASMATQDMKNREADKLENKMSLAFTSFFGKGSSEKTTQKRVKEVGKQKQLKDPKVQKKTSAKAVKKDLPLNQSMSDAAKKGLDLSSTSLVLFEEVDVIFEEDKGFWMAIQTFMSTTKRPIVMTARNDSVCSLIDGQYEQLTLQMPTLNNMATYLQLVCLAEGMRTSSANMRALVGFLRGDLRQSLHTLQFWALSNAVLTPSTEPVRYNPDFLKPICTEATKLKPSKAVSDTLAACNSDSDFETTPVLKRRQCSRNVIQDESSVDSIQDSPSVAREVNGGTEDSQDSDYVVNTMLAQPDAKLMTAPSNLTYPPLYQAPLEAFYLTYKLNTSGILQHLQECVLGHSALNMDVLGHYQRSGFNLLYANWQSLLNLPCTTPVRCPSTAVFSHQTKVRKLIKCATELFSSDESEAEDFVYLQKSGEKDKNRDLENLNASKHSKPSEEAKIAIGCVRSLSAMYDTFSYVDAHMRLETELQEGPCDASQHVWSCGRLVPGHTDQGPRLIKNEGVNAHLNMEALMHSQFLGVAQCREELSGLLANVDNLSHTQQQLANELLSIPRNTTELNLTDEFPLYENLRVRHLRTYEYVNSILPLHVQTRKRVIATDYIPGLETMCRSEQLRKTTNTKRRFLHYMDSIGLPLCRKQHAMDVLCSSFV